MTRLAIATTFVALVFTTTAANAVPPTGWDNRVIVLGAERERIEQTDILQRANRPLHFYGNTVRRRHYDGRVVPSIVEVRQAARALIRRR